MAAISSERCEGGFKAKVSRVVLLASPKGRSGEEVAHDAFPDHFAKSQRKAEQLAGAHFKACAKLETLGL
jgi:hypothetical protein